MKCETHKCMMVKVGRRDYICPECNHMTMAQLKAHLRKTGELKR